MEWEFVDYKEHINDMLKDYKIFEALENIKTQGKFVLNNRNKWEPLDYPGYTFITPPFTDDKDNVSTYRMIQSVKIELSKQMNSCKVVEAPDNALHVTIARLISGDKYVSNIKDTKEKNFQNYFKTLFSRYIISGQLEFDIKGVTVFPDGIIAAVVSPVYKNDYLCLQELRNYIYSDKKLIKFGVERKRSFLGHITLFYVEKELDSMEKKKILHSILDINARRLLNSMSFTIKRVEVRKFNNYLSFDREENWPVFEFV